MFTYIHTYLPIVTHILIIYMYVIDVCVDVCVYTVQTSKQNQDN